jgi:hypothetical protein
MRTHDSTSIGAPVSHEVISTCPVCSQELAVTRLRCASCGTTIEGEFRVGRFGGLTREQMALLESFLRSRGNLREMERELGLSYPTVRSRVDALVRALGLGGPAGEGEPDERGEPAEAGKSNGEVRAAEVGGARREILERLARHEISAPEAAAAIKQLGRTR